jgi:superfamily I DNA/RNA helicase
MARLAAPSGQAPTRHRAAPNARGLTATGAGRAASIVRPHRHLTPKSYTVSAMAPRHLINENGKPFEDGELDALSKELNALDPAERRNFRDANARAVARHSAIRMLIVAGPGTGKSTLFKERILFWLEQDASAKVLALSFVRKLVADLAADVQNDTTLTAEQKRQADIFTLHKYARSVVEQNHGTKEWKFAPHFRVIGQDWKNAVWDDVLLVKGQKDRAKYSWKQFEKQLHDDEFDESAEWTALKNCYFTLCKFYNAAGFADLILRAKDALSENPDLNKHGFFIFDEYQDFNAAEEHLLEQITYAAEATLIVGDDDQVLYETLKSGKASLIRAIYRATDTVNAMLPYCGRCDFHIAFAASHFIKQSPDADCIKKIYLPLSDAEGCKKVQVIACATPATAVDYIRKFIEDHRHEIEKRKRDLAEGRAKDAYLLILSPSKAVDFYKPNGARDELFNLVALYRNEERKFSDEYYKVLSYYSLANYPSNNFTFRKVLYYEGIRGNELLALLRECLARSKPFSALDGEYIKNALAKATKLRDILDSKETTEKKIEALTKHIQIDDLKLLQEDLERRGINKQRIEAIEHQDEEEAELEEMQVKQMSAVELMTIVGAKGLSADHVIVIGFDNVNMNWVTRNAFFVAKTRARKSLHMITALKAGGAAGPHRFLDHLPDSHLEFSRYTKGNRTQGDCGGRNGFLRYLANLTTQGRRH